MNQCPKCGRFVSHVTGMMDMNGVVYNVVAKCAKCGTVTVKDWYWEQFQKAYEAMEAPNNDR